MWIYTTGNDDLPPIILYDYQPGRGQEYPNSFLSGFKGYLQTDGYAGYHGLENVIHMGCWAHARRKFVEAQQSMPKGQRSVTEDEADPERARNTQKLPAEIGLAYCNKLFYIERTLKGLDPEERKAKRLEREVPVWDSFWEWLGTVNPVGGSKLEKAVKYAFNHRERLTNYLLDGRCEISNNKAERCAKAYGIGRKNFLFHTSVDGAKSSAILYSLIETAKANGLNVFQYLYTLLFVYACPRGG